MKISRSSRFFAAFFLIFSMLFMQIAIASYVCPSVAMGNDTGALTAVEISVDTSNMSNCVGMDKVQPSLCYAYNQDQQSKQSLDKTQLPDVQPFTPAGILFALPSFDFNAQSSFGQPTRPFQIRPDSPPIAILHCCFRI